MEVSAASALARSAHDPLAMTTRARVYLSAAGWRHLLIGLTLLLLPWLYSAAAFVPIFNWIPLVGWGAIMTAEGLLCLVAALLRNSDMARTAIGISAVITMVLAAGLGIGIVAAWLAWVGHVGPDQAWELIVTHPNVFPAALLGFAPAPPSPFIPIIMLAITVKDFTMCAQPLRVPLEETVGDVRRRGV